MAHKHLGQDFIPHDVVAKVTGEAKFAEDFRVDGMVFARLLGSTHPHARVKSIDLSAAEQVPGYVGVLLPADVMNPPPPNIPLLTDEPGYVGAPILLLAADSETAAHDALEKVKVVYEPLPFHVDPLASLHPDRPDARSDGNIGAAGVDLATLKWTAEDFDGAGERMPMGKAAQEWTYGDVEAGFAQAKLVLDESFVHASNSHHSMEPRTAMAYWQNGKCILHVSSQSQSFIHPALAGMIGIAPTDLVLTTVMNMRRVRDYASAGNGRSQTHVYAMGEGGPAAELHVAVEPGLPVVEPGAGGVHHVAFRTPDAEYQAWADRLRELRIPSSGPVDRYYFRSLYFREPNGILFEIASDGPGFAADEPLERLGEKLALPPFLEPKRRQIEAGLKPL